MSTFVTGQLTSESVLGWRSAASESDFAKGGVTDLAVPRAMRMGGDGRGVQIVGHDPVQRIFRRALDGTYSYSLTSKAVF